MNGAVHGVATSTASAPVPKLCQVPPPCAPPGAPCAVSRETGVTGSPTGSLVSDDGKTEYPVDATSLEGGMFRFLRTGQRVTFDLVDEGGEKKTRNLRIGLV